MATRGGGGGVRGRKRRSPNGFGGFDTILQKLVCPAVYQKETFMFLYDFFMCRASTSPPTSAAMRTLGLPSSNDYIAAHFMLANDTTTAGTTDESPPPAIPIEQLLEYRYEDDRYETSMELEARLRSFPTCRIIHERLTSYRIMSYERTLQTITIVMEVAVDVLFRQCRLYLLQEKEDNTAQCMGGILLTESLRLSYHDVGRMFVGAWRDYVMQSRFGRCHPRKISLKVLREPVIGTNVVAYYRERLGIDQICNDDIVLDYYAFQCEEIKKGTNLSRLTQSMQQLELGEHVNPRYVSIFRALYRRMIVEPLQFLRIQSEYTSAALVSSSDGVVVGGDDSSKRGRKRRDPERIRQLFTEEKRKRALWYRQQQQQYIEDQQRQEDEENQQMLDEILSSLHDTIVLSSSLTNTTTTTNTVTPISTTATMMTGEGCGRYRKNIENCLSETPPTPPPKRRRRRTTKNTMMTMMLANIKL